MAFLRYLMDFLKKNAIVLSIAAVLLAVVIYYHREIIAYISSFWEEPGPITQTRQQESESRDVHIAPYHNDTDDFNYLDLSSAVVVPVTVPTNDTQSFTKRVDENGMVIWEPNVMMDPVDILGEDEFERALDAARPTVHEQQLRRLTTPRVLQQEGNMFWGTPWPEGGPGLAKGCITREDVVHKGVYAEDTDHGTFGAGNCTF